MAPGTFAHMLRELAGVTPPPEAPGITERPAPASWRIQRPMPPRTGKPVGMAEQISETQRAELTNLQKQIDLQYALNAANYAGVDATNAAEIAIRAHELALERGTTVTSDYVEKQMELWSAQQGGATGAAARAEMVTQEQLQAEIAARGQQTEELRIQQRLLDAREQHGEFYLSLMADEIVATERLRTQLETIVTTLDLTQQLEDMKLATQFAGQETEEYRRQVGELEIKRRQAGLITEEQKRLNAEVQKEATARQSAEAAFGLEQQLETAKLLSKFVGVESEEYRRQLGLLELKQAGVENITEQHRQLNDQLVREATLHERNAALLRQRQERQGLELEGRFMGENMLSQMMGLGQSEEFRVQEQLLQARQRPGGLQEGMEASIRQTERMKTELALMETAASTAGEELADMTMALQEGEGEEWARGMIASLQKVALEALFTQMALLAMQSAMGGPARARAPAPARASARPSPRARARAAASTAAGSAATVPTRSARRAPSCSCRTPRATSSRTASFRGGFRRPRAWRRRRFMSAGCR